MKKLLLVLPIMTTLVACDTPTQSTLTGAAAGNFVGRTQSGDCVYQRPDGSRDTAACP